jgi:hypothetical protein
MLYNCRVLNFVIILFELLVEESTKILLEKRGSFLFIH